MFVDPHSEFLGNALEFPGQLGRVDQRRPTHPEQPARVGRRVDLGAHRLLIEPLDLLAHRAQQIVLLAQFVEVRRRMVDVSDVDHTVALVVAVHRVPLDRCFDVVEVAQAQFFERVDLVGVTVHAVADAVGDRGLHEATVAPARRATDLAFVDDDHVA